jgi:hypothetical protein
VKRIDIEHEMIGKTPVVRVSYRVLTRVRPRGRECPPEIVRCGVYISRRELGAARSKLAVFRHAVRRARFHATEMLQEVE